MADLDPALIERGFDDVSKAREREATIKFGARPAQARKGLGTIVVAGGKDTDGGVGLFGLGSIVAYVIFVDRRFLSTAEQKPATMAE
ncbi:hypothetical protein [Sphingobium fuliginis]|jgi:hypothetical protein|uniref:hypothetical protein n=1 Tax=Sphingobium fuliginis (strain ATCC 27551) TaxID=336203 RepID=UPI0037CC09E8